MHNTVHVQSFLGKENDFKKSYIVEINSYVVEIGLPILRPGLDQWSGISVFLPRKKISNGSQ